MDKFDVKQGKHTPKILLDPDQMIFNISGSSLPEDVEAFYQPVINWLDQFIENVSSDNKSLDVSVKFNYYNSGSMRYIAEIFKRIRAIHTKGVQTLITWHYEEEDELLKEAGEDLADVTGLNFKFVAV
jgi:hypothetical protein